MTPSAVRHPLVSSSATAPEPRRRSGPPPPHLPGRRRLLHLALTFLAVAFVADGLVGEKSFIVTSRARQQSQLESARIAALREENARLREERQRLMEDAATIEAEARRQLGLARAGEVMFILKNIQSVDHASSSHSR